MCNTLNQVEIIVELTSCSNTYIPLYIFTMDDLEYKGFTPDQLYSRLLL